MQSDRRFGRGSQIRSMALRDVCKLPPSEIEWTLIDSLDLYSQVDQLQVESNDSQINDFWNSFRPSFQILSMNNTKSYFRDVPSKISGKKYWHKQNRFMYAANFPSILLKYLSLHLRFPEITWQDPVWCFAIMSVYQTSATVGISISVESINHFPSLGTSQMYFNDPVLF